MTGPRTSARSLGIASVVAALVVSACASGGGVTCPACPTCPEPAAQPRPASPPIDAAALATDRSRSIDLMGFSKDGGVFALRVSDELMGRSFQIYDFAADKVIKTHLFTAFTEESSWRKARRRHKIVELTSASQRQPGADLLLLAGDSGDWVIVYALRGERAVPYLRIPRLKSDDGAPAAVAVKRIAWEPHGRYVVVIHNQIVKRPRRFESDYLEVFSVDPARLPFD